MIDIANEFKVPSCLFFTSPAAFCLVFCSISKFYKYDQNFSAPDEFSSISEMTVSCVTKLITASVFHLLTMNEHF